jgi:hypothetical protein
MVSVHDFCWRRYLTVSYRGQLGVGTVINHNTPQLVSSLRDVVDVSCGTEHTGVCVHVHTRVHRI